MTSSFLRRLYAIPALVVTTLLLGLAACGVNDKERRNEDIATIRARVDNVRRCATLLDGNWPLEVFANELNGQRVTALVAAGLVRRVAIKNPRPGMQTARIDLTPLGQANVVIDRSIGKAGYARLCYGQQRLISVYEKKIIYHNDEKDLPDAYELKRKTLFYDYRIVNAPAWTARADIRAAFPFIVRELEQVYSVPESASALTNPFPEYSFKP
jgi:hypothetical protein